MGDTSTEDQPFAFFNLLNPLVALVYAFTGFHIEHVPAVTPAIDDRPGTPQPERTLAIIPEGDGHVD